MKTTIEISSNQSISIDLDKPIDISIPLNTAGPNPNCYYADEVSVEIIRSGNFIGSVKEGGAVNYKKLFFTPHGNGTHTECLGHITAGETSINQALTTFNFYARLITVEPIMLDNGDYVIDDNALGPALQINNHKALIIRTLPNDDTKLVRQYSGQNPPYFTKESLELLVDRGVEHILVDLPSIDKEEDAGKLEAHRAFWQMHKTPRSGATITELIYVPNEIEDGDYFLQLNIPSLEMDAAPSKPVIYQILRPSEDN